MGPCKKGTYLYEEMGTYRNPMPFEDAVKVTLHAEALEDMRKALGLDGQTSRAGVVMAVWKELQALRNERKQHWPAGRIELEQERQRTIDWRHESRIALRQKVERKVEESAAKKTLQRIQKETIYCSDCMRDRKVGECRHWSLTAEGILVHVV